MDANAPPAAAVGFLGLGAMGHAIAHRLRSAGTPLVVYNRAPGPADALAAEGATRVDRPIEVGRRVGPGVVFTMVADHPATRTVLFGRGGLARGLPPGAVVVDLSTVGPEQSRDLAARLAKRGVHYLEAPVGGSVPAAADGTLTAFVGGDAADLDRVRPLLDLFARRVEHLGEVGAGSAMKLVNNLITTATVALAAEALALGEGLGLPRERMLELLVTGGARSAMLERKREFLARRTYPMEFRLRLAAKDLRLIERAGRDCGRPVRFAREARRLVDEGIAAGYGDQDFSSVLEAALARGTGAAPPPAPAPPPG